jgi:uncharacterized membrane protein
VTRAGVGDPGDPSGVGLERTIARLLTVGTYTSIVLLAIGFGLMLVDGIGPLDGAPPFDPRAIPADILALRPTGFLWLGLIVVVATPSARVAASLVGYLRSGERRMAVVAAAILVVITLSVVLASGLEG